MLNKIIAFLLIAPISLSCFASYSSAEATAERPPLVVENEAELAEQLQPDSAAESEEKLFDWPKIIKQTAIDAAIGGSAAAAFMGLGMLGHHMASKRPGNAAYNWYHNSDVDFARDSHGNFSKDKVHKSVLEDMRAARMHKAADAKFDINDYESKELDKKTAAISRVAVPLSKSDFAWGVLIGAAAIPTFKLGLFIKNVVSDLIKIRKEPTL